MAVPGRYAVIIYRGQSFLASVLDTLPDGNPGRVRIQHSVWLNGEELQPGDYAFKEWADDCDD